MLEGVVAVGVSQKRTPITAEGAEMECSAVLITDEDFRHSRGFYRRIELSTFPRKNPPVTFVMAGVCASHPSLRSGWGTLSCAAFGRG
jgi:hypothetical protein